MRIPRLDDYDINILVILGNQTNDMFTYNHIKSIILKKILELNYPLFFLIRKYIYSENVLREVYADVIVMSMRDNEYYLDDVLCDDIVKFASIESLMYYGMESSLEYFKEKCRDEFWNRVIEIENREELNRKISLDKKHTYKIKSIGKVIKNDKY